MTDKANNFEKDINVPSKEQIIIDGVNVSECERHCSDNYNTPNMCYSDITRGYRHCNPKENQCDFYITSIEEQLALKTQECEELKGRLDYIRQENKNLKDSATAEQIDYVSLKNYISTLEFAENRYRKALEEIKEIVSSTLDCGEWVGQGDDKMAKILDIINKAKGGEDER